MSLWFQPIGARRPEATGLEKHLKCQREDGDTDK